MSDRIRFLASVVLFGVVAACGGDSGSGSAASACQDGALSVPGSSVDPCKSSPAAQECGTTGTALAMCSGGHWGTCTCMVKTPTAPPTGSTMNAAASLCGNGTIDTTAGEMCDGMAMNGASCATVVPGSVGLLNCKDCKFDMSLCTKAAASPSGGSGAAQGGTGATATATTGSGGSGGTGH